MSRFSRVIADRRNVLVAVILLTAVTVVVIETVTVRSTRTQLIARTDASLRSQLESTQLVVNTVTPQVLLELSKVDRVFTRDDTTTVLDARGRTITQLPYRTSGGQNAVPVLPSFAILQQRLNRPFDVAGTGGVRHFRVIAGTIGRGQFIAFATPLTAVDGTVSDLTHDALLIGALAIALLALILWRLLAAATRPIDSMIDVAARIGAGDFAARVEPESIHGDAARLGVALNQMVIRIEQAFTETSASEATLRRFVADASHELRTPLTSIRGYAQLLRMGAAGDDFESAIVRIDTEATRMAILVDDLLLLARLDQGRPLEREPVDVVALVSELASEARMLEPRRPIEFDAPAEELFVLGDKSRLHQVLRNLLDNVRSHTDPRTECSVRVEADATHVTLSIADNGGGMTAADAQHAFDRFYRADGSRSRDSGGSGLGLSIAKAIVDAHGGDIQLTTAPGEGTTVRIRLPRDAREPAPAIAGSDPVRSGVSAE